MSLDLTQIEFFLARKLKILLRTQPVANPFSYREPSPLFNYRAATDNQFGAPVGYSGEAYADGYYLMIEPLGSGTHTFRFGGGISAFEFSVEVNDTITAVPEPTSTLGFLALGILGTASTLKRKLKPVEIAAKKAEEENERVK